MSRCSVSLPGISEGCFDPGLRRRLGCLGQSTSQGRIFKDSGDRAGRRVVPGHRSLPGIDLNTDFSIYYAEQFDVITAIEIIEHLENPTHFLRECRKLLKPGGVLLITTPNIESVPSRIKLLFKGKIKHFGKGDDPTHISPIISAILPRLSARSGFRVDRSLQLVRKWDTRPALRALSVLMAPFLPGVVYGECHLFVLRPA